MNANPRQQARLKLVSVLGIGLLALSVSMSAQAEGQASPGKKSETPAAKKAEKVSAKKPEAPPKQTTTQSPLPPIKRASPGAPNQRRVFGPGHAKPLQAPPHAGLRAHGSKVGGKVQGEGADNTSAPGQPAEKPKGPTRRDREVDAESKVKRRLALSRYKLAKKELDEADKSLGDTSEVDPIEARAARKAAAQELKYARKALFNSHKAQSKRYKDQHKEAWKDYNKKLRMHEAGLRKDRKSRADASRLSLEKRYGRKLELNTVRHELQSHAWRVARLKRLIEIAEVTERPEAKKRAEKILKTEMQAHKKRLAKLSLAPLPKPKLSDVKGAQKALPGKATPHGAPVKTLPAQKSSATPPQAVPSSKGVAQ